MKQKIKNFICRILGHTWKYGEFNHRDGRQCELCKKTQRSVAKDTWNGIEYGYLDEGIEWNRENMHLADFGRH